jgi:hypothetical protein
MSALAPVADKIAKLIKLLSSNRDGEVVAAARALCRTLESAGGDLHMLAATIENPSGSLSEAEMQRLYTAGYDDGVRAAENAHHGADDFANIDGTPSWHKVALYCQRNSGKLEERHHKFINDMASRTVWAGEPTEKQQRYLLSLFYKLGGRL